MKFWMLNNVLFSNELEKLESLRHSAQEIWEIGQKLVDVRSRLKHGQFETLKAEA